MKQGTFIQRLRLVGKIILFPGLDLHTRCRYRFLPALLCEGDLDTLDAGFGNGALTYAAYRKGNRVLGVSIAEGEVKRTVALFDYLGIARNRVELRVMNIYDLRNLGRAFDQIICSEALEHIARDAEVVRMFADLLKPGGRLVLCCPYALHPEHALGRTNEPETGYHVRDGYTLKSYQSLLEGTSMRIVKTLGLGSPLLCWLDKLLRGVRNRFGDLWAFPLFLVLLPLSWPDYTDPLEPFSLVVVAKKQ